MTIVYRTPLHIFNQYHQKGGYNSAWSEHSGRNDCRQVVIDDRNAEAILAEHSAVLTGGEGTATTVIGTTPQSLRRLHGCNCMESEKISAYAIDTEVQHGSSVRG